MALVTVLVEVERVKMVVVCGSTSSSINCFWMIQVALIRVRWCDLMQADLLI